MFRDIFQQNSTISSDVENVGGIVSELKLIPSVLVNRILVKPDGELEEFFIQLKKPGYDCTKIEIANGSGEAFDEMQDDANSNLYNLQINFKIPKDSLAVQTWLKKHSEMEFIAIVLTRNLDVKCYGNPEFPLRLTTAKSSSGQNGGQNSNDWSLTGVSREKSYHQTGGDFEKIIRLSSYDNSISTVFT